MEKLRVPAIAALALAFTLEQYALLAEAARTIKGKMIVSVNDIPEMRKAFRGLKIRSVAINHTLGQKYGKTAKRKELIIRSW